jgi:hypothetical protein
LAGERNSDSASGAAGKASKRERNERFSERRGERVVVGRKKRAIQRAVWRARRRKEKETSDSASGAAGVSPAGERNGRFSNRRGERVIRGRKKQRFSQRRAGRVVGGRKKRAIQ